MFAFPLPCDSIDDLAVAAKPEVVWPWQAEPFRLWSLCMLRHLAGNWLAAIETLARLRWLLLFGVNDQTVRAQFLTDRDRSLVWIEGEIKSLPFSISLQRQVARLMQELRAAQCESMVSNQSVITLLDEVAYNIQAELESHLFFVVPAERKKWFDEDDAPLFGRPVSDRFPDSASEIAEAGRCFALARWTACVFHLMRALEMALHRWAEEVGVNQFSAIELENWKNILDAAEKKIKTIESQPKSLVKDADLKYYGETLGHFRAVKDAWRNHVAHAREKYDEGRASSIMNHVKEFMVLLASRP